MTRHKDSLKYIPTKKQSHQSYWQWLFDNEIFIAKKWNGQHFHWSRYAKMFRMVFAFTWWPWMLFWYIHCCCCHCASDINFQCEQTYYFQLVFIGMLSVSRDQHIPIQHSNWLSLWAWNEHVFTDRYSPIFNYWLTWKSNKYWWNELQNKQFIYGHSMGKSPQLCIKNKENIVTSHRMAHKNSPWLIWTASTPSMLLLMSLSPVGFVVGVCICAFSLSLVFVLLTVCRSENKLNYSDRQYFNDSGTPFLLLFLFCTFYFDILTYFILLEKGRKHKINAQNILRFKMNEQLIPWTFLKIDVANSSLSHWTTYTTIIYCWLFCWCCCWCCKVSLPFK